MGHYLYNLTLVWFLLLFEESYYISNQVPGEILAGERVAVVKYSGLGKYFPFPVNLSICRHSLIYSSSL